MAQWCHQGRWLNSETTSDWTSDVVRLANDPPKRNTCRSMSQLHPSSLSQLYSCFGLVACANIRRLGFLQPSLLSTCHQFKTLLNQCLFKLLAVTSFTTSQVDFAIGRLSTIFT